MGDFVMELKVLGIVAIYIAVIIGMFFISKKYLFKGDNQTNRYDERQLIARGKAYKLGFWTFGVVQTVYFFASELSDNIFFKINVNCMLGFFIGATVFSLVCVMEDAYIGINDKPKTALASAAIIAIANAITVINAISKNTLFDERGSDALLNLYGCITMIIMFFAVLLKNFILNDDK